VYPDPYSISFIYVPFTPFQQHNWSKFVKPHMDIHKLPHWTFYFVALICEDILDLFGIHLLPDVLIPSPPQVYQFTVLSPKAVLFLTLFSLFLFHYVIPMLVLQCACLVMFSQHCFAHIILCLFFHSARPTSSSTQKLENNLPSLFQTPPTLCSALAS